ncbi:hypothetical protein ACFLYS_00920 [Chloroflexota bacterium]
MIEGKCSRCGTTRYGWALLNPRYQTCPTCGAGLEIFKDGVMVTKGFSPFTADRIDVKQQKDTPSPQSQKLSEDEK